MSVAGDSTLHHDPHSGVHPRPLAELLFLAAPTVAQMASYTLMQFIDTLILAHSGQGGIPPTAAANAGILAFAAIALGMGVMFVVNTLASQSFGRKDFPAAGRFMWQGIWFAMFFGLAMFALLPLATRIFYWAGHEPELARLEGIYLRIVLTASVMKLASAAIQQFFLGINRPFSVALSTVCGVSVNALAAWALVLGHLGFSPHGVAGSAVAQNIAVGVELSVMIAFTFTPAMCRKFELRHWKFHPRDMLTLMKVGLPTGVQMIADVLAWSAFSIVVMGVYGTAAMAANIFIFRYMSVSFMPAFGIGVAVTALVGRYIGMGRPDIAMKRAHLGFVVAAVYMLGCGLVFFLFRRQLLALFHADADVMAIGATLFIFAALYQVFDSLYIVYNGALRGAGDTLVPALVTGGLCWTLTVVGGYVSARIFRGLGPGLPWSIALAYGILLGIFMIMRFHRGGWRKIRLHSSSNTSPPIDDSTKLPVVETSI
jgi:multidrug resistance protein, MATE family